MFSEWVMRYGRQSGIIASVVTVTTLLSCYITARVTHKYTNGLKWPFFSEIGRGKLMQLLLLKRVQDEIIAL